MDVAIDGILLLAAGENAVILNLGVMTLMMSL